MLLSLMHVQRGVLWVLGHLPVLPWCQFAFFGMGGFLLYILFYSILSLFFTVKACPMPFKKNLTTTRNNNLPISWVDTLHVVVHVALFHMMAKAWPALLTLSVSDWPSVRRWSNHIRFLSCASAPLSWSLRQAIRGRDGRVMPSPSCPEPRAGSNNFEMFDSFSNDERYFFNPVRTECLHFAWILWCVCAMTMCMFTWSACILQEESVKCSWHAAACHVVFTGHQSCYNVTLA